MSTFRESPAPDWLIECCGVNLKVPSTAQIWQLPVFVDSPDRTVAVVSNLDLSGTMKHHTNSFAMGSMPYILSCRGVAVGMLNLATTATSKGAISQLLQADSGSVVSALNSYTASTLPSDLILGTFGAS
jgi:hypothetical protein